MNAGSDDVVFQEQIPGGRSGAAIPQQRDFLHPDLFGKECGVNRATENGVADQDNFGLVLAQVGDRFRIEISPHRNEVGNERRHQDDGRYEYR